MAIQLFPLSTRSSNNLGASGRKSWGRRQPSSHTTLTIAAVTLGSSPSSINRSLILGQAGRRVSGYTKANLYSVTIVFLRTVGCECVSRGRRSDRTDNASEGVIICGSVMIGRDIVVTAVEVRSYRNLRMFSKWYLWELYLLQEIRCKHQNLGVWSKALNSAQIAHSFL